MDQLTWTLFQASSFPPDDTTVTVAIAGALAVIYPLTGPAMEQGDVIAASIVLSPRSLPTTVPLPVDCIAHAANSSSNAAASNDW